MIPRDVWNLFDLKLNTRRVNAGHVVWWLTL